MTQDNPDTMPLIPRTRWAETHPEDVFTPHVRVILSWKDIELAVEQGAVLPSMAHTLWAYWAAPGCPTRMEDSATVSDAPAVVALPQAKLPPSPRQAVRPSASGAATPSGPRFSFTNTLYYFGGMRNINR